MARTADKDKDAFADLYDALAPQLLDEIRFAWGYPVRAVAVLSATFVEVWTLARFHTGPGLDVAAWITDVASRRTTDRRLAEHRHPHGEGTPGTVSFPRRQLSWTAVADSYDRQYVLCLAALLNRPHLVTSVPGAGAQNARALRR